MSIPFVLTDLTATVYIDGETFTVPRDWEGFDALTTLISGNGSAADIRTHLGGYQAIPVGVLNRENTGKVAITRRAVTYNGVAVHSTLARRMLDIAQAGLPVDPWIRFMENVYANPADYAREELYEWLETADLPITDDGCFLAYKRVSDDFKDLHTRTFDNSPGVTVTMPGGRPAVDSDRNQTCSTGLHFCSKSYLSFFGAYGGNKVVLVKVNPKDVVSIPADHGNAKGRTWQYEVIQEVEGVLPDTWNSVAFRPEDTTEDWFEFDPNGNPVTVEATFTLIFEEETEAEREAEREALEEAEAQEIEDEWAAYYEDEDADEDDEGPFDDPLVDEDDQDGSQPPRSSRFNLASRLFGGK